jgi:outer membrane protein OmpA-like peptidoglycan-associated protein
VAGVRGRDPIVLVGHEIWWRELLGARCGFRVNGRDLGDFTFGFGFRWNDALNGLFGLPTRFGNVFQADVADAGFGDVLKQTYRGGLSHFPSAPEPFSLYDPVNTAAETESADARVTLHWEATEDPDPFDDLRYIVLVDRQKQKLERAIRQMETGWSAFWEPPAGTRSIRDSLFYCKPETFNENTLSVSEGGRYFWAVAAVDRGGHVRIAKRGKTNLGEFLVSVPDLSVSKIAFAPISIIDRSTLQGRVTVRVANQGSSTSDSCGVRVEDVTIPASPVLLERGMLGRIPVRGEAELSFVWRTPERGRRLLRVTVDPDSTLLEQRKNNNEGLAAFFTVPKGALSAPDSVQVMVTGYSKLEVPLVPEVYFGLQSDAVSGTYVSATGAVPALLQTLAKRMIDHPDVPLKVMGSIDALSGEKDAGLADRRAAAVKEKLTLLGVPAGRIEVVTKHADKVMGRRPMPKDPVDATRIMEQNRVVSFATEVRFEETLFQPYQFAVDTTLRDSVEFIPRVVSASGIRSWELDGQTGALEIDSRRATVRDSLSGVLVWRGTDRNKVVVPRNRWSRYAFTLTDTLGRTFRTSTDSIFLQEKRTIERQEIFGAAKFGKVEPVYAFYWDRVMSVASALIDNPDMRVRFEGHACAIGPDRVNDKLSFQRAADFTKNFLERVRVKFPGQYADIRRRVADPIGAGEHEPLILHLKGEGEVLLGDNDSPSGRYLNRRIAVLLYREN